MTQSDLWVGYFFFFDGVSNPFRIIERRNKSFWLKFQTIQLRIDTDFCLHTIKCPSSSIQKQFS